jgi:hypothetical protein
MAGTFSRGISESCSPKRDWAQRGGSQSIGDRSKKPAARNAAVSCAEIRGINPCFSAPMPCSILSRVRSPSTHRMLFHSPANKTSISLVLNTIPPASAPSGPARVYKGSANAIDQTDSTLPNQRSHLQRTSVRHPLTRTSRPSHQQKPRLSSGHSTVSKNRPAVRPQEEIENKALEIPKSSDGASNPTHPKGRMAGARSSSGQHA